MVKDTQEKLDYSLCQRLGIISEKFLFAILKSFFPKKLGYNFWHVPWDNYTAHMGKSIDLQLFFKGLLLIDFEVKNWRLKQKYRYGVQDALEQIVARFKNSTAKLKVLVITFLDQLSRPAQKLLEKHNIIVLETSKLVGKKDYRTSLFKELGFKIKKLVIKVQAGGFLDGCCSKQLQLDNIQYTTNSSNYTNSNTVINKLNDSDCNNVVNFLVMAISRAINLNSGNYG